MQNTQHTQDAEDSHDDERTGRRRPRSKGLLIVLALIGALLFAGFAALGTWQVKRLGWKQDLMARVDQRAHATPVPLPDRAQWPRINAADDEYRRVQATGTFLHEQETLVQAVSDLGSGFWVMTPLRLADGSSVLVNRGFVSPVMRDPAMRSANAPSGDTTVTGLLRITQPDGGFLQKNDPAANRWYSRDVAAIAAARGLNDVAPYFIDADAVPTLGAAKPAAPKLAEAMVAESLGAQAVWPVGGLTVITFQNNHLVYAITWYALALMIVGIAWFVRRDARRHARRDLPRQRAAG